MSDIIAANIIKLLDQSGLRTGASRLAVERAESEIGRKFPDDYITFMMNSNGFSGFVNNASFLRICQIEELIEMNRILCTDVWNPGVLLFGSDGGGEAYGFDYAHELLPVVELPDIPLRRNEITIVATTFNRFIEFLSIEDIEEADSAAAIMFGQMLQGKTLQTTPGQCVGIPSLAALPPPGGLGDLFRRNAAMLARHGLENSLIDTLNEYENKNNILAIKMFYVD